MKIRYYLRGLGLGILVTAIFFMVSGENTQTMSDEMIKARAKELGMSESVVLSELSTEEKAGEEIPEETVAVEESVSVEETVTEPAETETVVEEETMVEEETVAEEETVIEEVTSQEPVSEEEVAETLAEQTEEIASNSEPVTVTVNRGEGSDTVSRHLQEMGLVADAHEYDRYLMANGYDKRIGAGEHVIPAGATWEDIAKILCNMK